jgi:hypothetical protein
MSFVPVALSVALCLVGGDVPARTCSPTDVPSIDVAVREDVATHVHGPLACIPWLEQRPWQLSLEMNHRAYEITSDGTVGWWEWNLPDRHFRLASDQLASLYEAAREDCTGVGATSYVASNDRDSIATSIEPRSRGGIMLDRFADELETRYIRERRAALGRVELSLNAVVHDEDRTGRYHVRIVNDQLSITRGGHTLAQCALEPEDLVDFIDGLDMPHDNEAFAHGTLLAGGVRRAVELVQYDDYFTVGMILMDVVYDDTWNGSRDPDVCRAVRRERQLIRGRGD